MKVKSVICIMPYTCLDRCKLSWLQFIDKWSTAPLPQLFYNAHVHVAFKVWSSDVARPLSYKTKITYFFKTKTGQAKTKTKTTITFSRPRPLFLKTVKLLTQDHWRSQKFWLGLEKFLSRCFGDVMVMTSLKWRHNYILKFVFVIISFKIHHLSKSRNFRSPILKVKRRWGRFLKICY